MFILEILYARGTLLVYYSKHLLSPHLAAIGAVSWGEITYHINIFHQYSDLELDIPLYYILLNCCGITGILINSYK